MYPRSTFRRPRSSSGSRHPTRRLWLIAGATCVPLLIIAYALTMVGGESATGAASVSGTVAHGAHGQISGAGGWGRGGYTMMPGPAGIFTGVSSSWAVPTATCGASETFSSFWVGLDGAAFDTVEQTGTEADCANGAAAYLGWFEMFPSAQVR
jgi:hypothetical protein